MGRLQGILLEVRKPNWGEKKALINGLLTSQVRGLAPPLTCFMDALRRLD
jgi:hypothetical protein